MEPEVGKKHCEPGMHAASRPGEGKETQDQYLLLDF